jgi:hypothetical protein
MDVCAFLLLPQDSNFITALELAVRFGKTLIIQEMDGVEPVLYPLLRRDLVAQGKCLSVLSLAAFKTCKEKKPDTSL